MSALEEQIRQAAERQRLAREALQDEARRISEEEEGGRRDETPT